MKSEIAPYLSQHELDVCSNAIKEIEKRAALLQDPTWLPNQLEQCLTLIARDGSEDDFRLVVNLISWIRTARKWRYNAFQPKGDWLPGAPDVLKSRLFWRLRTGQDPLDYPPPTAFSCPWYELIEDNRAHWAYEAFVFVPKDGSRIGDEIEAPVMSIAQCSYVVVDMADGVPSKVSFGPYVFKVWKDKVATPSYNNTLKAVETILVDGWWLQLIETRELN